LAIVEKPPPGDQKMKVPSPAVLGKKMPKFVRCFKAIGRGLGEGKCVKMLDQATVGRKPTAKKGFFPKLEVG